MSELILEPGRSEHHYWRDLWRYRDLFHVLAWRDLTVRYKQTVIGVAWALLQPLVTMIVFTVIFGGLAKFPSAGVPYPLLVFAGTLPWQFFSNSLTSSSQSLIGNANLISKVYFPRLIIPASTVVAALVDFLISFFLMAATMVYYRFLPPVQIFVLPLFVIMGFLASLGPGLLLTALNVKYRDFRYIIPFLVTIGTYVSPVGFSSQIVAGYWRPLYYLNPMAGVIDGFRWALLGGQNTIYLPGFSLSIAVLVFFLALGIWYFRKMERGFADII
jgi:lipopolysaccharide transport system permease protein